ncbi:hypothetical protein WG906_08805 [Pedobacter sp. P351]|uniref:hypothetical protein n=1 Tax=Pedobacter superstes TaxID=3133441 RepID=UPI0030A23201
MASKSSRNSKESKEVKAMKEAKFTRTSKFIAGGLLIVLFVWTYLNDNPKKDAEEVCDCLKRGERGCTDILNKYHDKYIEDKKQFFIFQKKLDDCFEEEGDTPVELVEPQQR